MKRLLGDLTGDKDVARQWEKNADSWSKTQKMQKQWNSNMGIVDPIQAALDWANNGFSFRKKTNGNINLSKKTKNMNLVTGKVRGGKVHGGKTIAKDPKNQRVTSKMRQLMRGKGHMNGEETRAFLAGK